MQWLHVFCVLYSCPSEESRWSIQPEPIYICIYTYIYIYMCIYVYIYVYTHTYIRKRRVTLVHSARTCIHVNLRIYICIHIHTCIHKRRVSLAHSARTCKHTYVPKTSLVVPLCKHPKCKCMYVLVNVICIQKGKTYNSAIREDYI